ncbi:MULTISPECIES: LysR family transcriptional regulator [Agrobacterium]|uniref:HTH-type transcriptional regulator TtuA n=1 Tax=Agrobacterium rubi TaxID=28099 RepID=A0AAE7RD25_9HYPH|nr:MULTISPECIES: LysR substrate-binding domain-containing protein [Agrobacterium]MBN7808930.1 LysR family transcriptional regulator [Agrobacterium rosae]NTE89868.1 LysR family transcriptional regulator [Agrobacterium rubi]NTF05282.1 LysR family transcriptional regulator [Agrobacterium rubi]NTF10544.1 LysR family transcriptional regulator [Agrobacterium rubi]NTF22938.1 LysR family transcriptional regulator [Agrobacterium rubi]
MNFSFRQIRYFIAATESGQLSRAAIELNVSQSAVTTAIRQLEDALGITLFSRSSSGVTLTPEGQAFLRHARDIMATVEQAKQVKRNSEGEITGTIRIATTYTVAGYFLMPLLARFQRLYPDVEVELMEDVRSGVEASVLKNFVDIGIATTQDSHTTPRLSGIVRKTLHRSERRLWVAPNHPLLLLDEIGFREVASAPYIALTIDGAWEYAESYWDKSPFIPNVIFKTNSVEAIRTMVGNGMGVSILSDMIYRPWSLEGQRIETVDIAGDVPTVNVDILYHSDKEISPAARAFITFLQRSGHSS